MFTKIRLSIAIIAFTPLISLTAHSDIQNQILLQIDKLNRRDVGVPKATDPCTDCQAENSARELFNKCVDTICTSKGLRPYTSIPVENQTDLTTPVEGEKEYVELLNKIGEANKSSIPKKVQDNLLKLISSGKLEFSKEQADFAMQFIALSIFSSYSELDVAKKEYKFNEDAWNKAKLPLSAKNTAVLKIYLQNFLKRLGKIAFADRKALESSKSYLETKYPGVSKDHAIKQMVADFRADFEKFKSTGFGKLVSTMTDVDMMFPKELVSTIESGKDITEMNFKDLLAQKTQFENYQTFFDETDSKNLVHL